MEDVYLDTETTGFSPKNGDRLVSIGAIKGNEAFYVEIDPRRPIPQKVSAIHGIDSQYLKDRHAREFGHYADDLMKFIDGHRLIIHNASFDLRFLNYELAEHYKDPSFDLRKRCGIFDTLKLARSLYKDKRQSKSLTALAERFQIKDERKNHNAFDDACLLKSVTQVLFSEQAKRAAAQARLEASNPQKKKEEEDVEHRTKRRKVVRG